METIYRLDRFVAPKSARAEFLARVAETHATLRAQPGFLRDLVLERPAEGDAVEVVTLVEWADAQAMERAVRTMAARHAAAGFDRRLFLTRLGITAELGAYAGVAEFAPAAA